jgi:hypothetical protein
MTRIVAAAFLFLVISIGGASAQNCNAYPNNLTNGTNADATQVMGNFNYVLGCVRDKLTAARTYYVRTDGNDACNGLTNAAGSSGTCAFLTMQKAVDTVAGLDININNVTIQVADGTYTGAVTLNGPWLGSGIVTISGNTGTPANVLINCSAATACIVSKNAAQIYLSGMKLQNSVGHLLNADSRGFISFTTLDFGATPNMQMRASDGGGISCTGNYTISGGALAHIQAAAGGNIRMQLGATSVTITGTLNFGVGFAYAINVAAMSVAGMTFSGSASSVTGPRYSVSLNAVINTAGGAPTYFPGSSSGTSATGGQYL